MKNIETITAGNIQQLDDIMPLLAESYIDDFARSPWNEVSACPRCGTLSALSAGTLCATCAVVQVPAYTPEGLYATWTGLLSEGALIEVLSERDIPLRTTIAGPLTTAELYSRKYADVPQMEEWLDSNVPARVVYIYDTFANLKVRPSGNLNDRGQTLGRLSTAFAGLPILTRTLQPAIVRATVRDAGERTAVYLGEAKAGVIQALGAKSVSAVPDRRTLLSVEPEL